MKSSFITSRPVKFDTKLDDLNPEIGITPEHHPNPT